MLSKKSLLVAGAVASIGLGGAAVTANTVSATTKNDSIVDKIATKFSLDKNEVQKVFDEDRTAHEAERHAKIEEKLSQAVKDGKLTEDQKSKIIAKMEEMKANMPDPSTMGDKTIEQHKADMEAKRTELEAWAKENNIPTEYLRFVGPGGGIRVKHMRGGPDVPAKADVIEFGVEL